MFVWIDICFKERMQFMKRFISLLLVCCTLLLLLVSCGDKEQPTEPPKANQGTVDSTDAFGQKEFVSAVPADALDFEGEEVTILIRNAEQIIREWKKDVIEDELDQAVSDRNAIVESELGLTINVVTHGDHTWPTYEKSFIPLVTEDYNSGDGEYDIVAHFAYGASYTIFRDMIANMADREMFPYFGFDRPCWNKALVDNTLINDKLYYIAGDLNLSVFDSALILWHNKTLYNRYKNDEDPEDIQQLAIDGGWEYYQLYRWIELAENANQNTACGGTYGVAIDWEVCPADAIPYAWELDLLKTNNDGTHYYNIVGNEKITDALAMYRSLRNNVSNAPFECDDGCTVGDHFIAGQRIFRSGKIYWDKATNNALREMEDEYALLPLPKYDENQIEYGTTSQDYYSLVTVMNHVGINGELISAYLQYSNEKSYTDVRGYYFERIVKPKYFGGNPESATRSITLFNTIVDNIRLEFETIYSGALNDIMYTWRRAAIDDSETSSPSQLFESDLANFEADLLATDKWLGLITE